MAFESDLIRRYRGAFTPEDCEECIKYIDEFDKNNLGPYMREHRMKKNPISVKFNNSNYNFTYKRNFLF